MNALFWNVQGLGNPWTFDSLASYVRSFTPSIVFLSETRLDKNRGEWVRVKLGFEGCFMVEAAGKSGGLMLLWMHNVKISILSYTKFHIDAIVSIDDGCEWRITGFYGAPEASQRHQSWKLLERLSDMWKGQWIVGGDFNELLRDSEKQGGGEKPNYLIKNFRQAVDYCGLKEIEDDGTKFTWCNARPNGLIFEKLDRIFGNLEWMNRFLMAKVSYLPWWNSDHRPLLLTFNEVPDDDTSVQKKWVSRFHYEQAWAEDEECKRIVDKEWGQSNSKFDVENVRNVINRCGAQLHRWNKKKKTELNKCVKDIKGQLERLSNNYNREDWRKREILERKLNDYLAKQEIWWRQRSRALWLENGDRNTSYFHSKASRRRRKNEIKGLFDDNMVWKTNNKDLESIICKYFDELFEAECIDAEELNKFRECVPNKMTVEANEKLKEPFNK